MIGVGIGLTDIATRSAGEGTSPVEILSITGTKGLEVDAGGGAIVNGRTSTAIVEDWEGSILDCLANEIRYKGGRRVDHADGQMYNAGVLGIEYFDTETDGVTLLTGMKMLHEDEGTNYVFPASAPATQTITLTTGDYTVWLDDTDNLGQIVLTGGATGTASSTDVNGFQFTSTGAAITFTHSGGNNVRWQVEGGNYRTSFVDTTTAAGTRAADSINLPLSLNQNFYQDKGILEFQWVVGYDSPSALDNLRLFLDTMLTHKGLSGKMQGYDGTNVLRVDINNVVANDTIRASVCWNAAENLFSINYSLDLGVTWSTWARAAYDGAFTTGTLINLFYNNPYTNKLDFAKVYSVPATETMDTMEAFAEAQS